MQISPWYMFCATSVNFVQYVYYSNTGSYHDGRLTDPHWVTHVLDKLLTWHCIALKQKDELKYKKPVHHIYSQYIHIRRKMTTLNNFLQTEYSDQTIFAINLLKSHL